MAKHWDEATHVVETLATLLRGQDPDGLDLTFTIGQASRHSDSAQKLRKTMHRKDVEPTSGVHTDMASALGKNFSGYLRSMASLRGQPKYLSLYVLTDGIWSGTRDLRAVEDVITELSAKLERTDESAFRSKRRVGIQFIQFGDDPAATDALKILDNGLWDEGIS